MILISHNMADVMAVADRVAVLRLGRNNGVFVVSETKTQDIIAAITGATDNAVSERAARRTREEGPRHERCTDPGPARRSPAPGTATNGQDSNGEPVRRRRQLPADLQDERLIASTASAARSRAFTARLRSGDLGSVPVVVGLIIIWAVFQIANSSFLSSRNLVNLTLQTTSVGVIALGIVLVLLLGEIDLSVGSVSGLSAAVLGVTFVNQGWPLVLSLLAGVALGVADRAVLRRCSTPGSAYRAS